MLDVWQGHPETSSFKGGGRNQFKKCRLIFTLAN